MKRSLRLITLLVLSGLLLASCEGPMGPVGEQGTQGDKGDPGTTFSCTDCHFNNSPMSAYLAQWGESTHALGGNASYCNRTGCVQCHTSQGFLAWVSGESPAAIEIPVNPMQINCSTCHNIHTSYTSSDWALTNVGPQTLELLYGGEALVWDKGNSNQCVACHQAQVVSPAPVPGGADFTVTNVRMGPHHAPHANMVMGRTQFEPAGSATYPAGNYHNVASGCVTCHMSDPYGYQAGGHNMGIWYDEHGQKKMLYTGCVSCHEGVDMVAKVAGLEATIDGKMDRLKAQLTEAGVYNSATGLLNAGSFKPEAVAAMMVYLTVEDDHSHGVHNPRYTKALLDNTISSMEVIGFADPGK